MSATRTPSDRPMRDSDPASDGAAIAGRTNRRPLLAMSFVFLALGPIAFFVGFARPFVEARAANAWTPTPRTITRSLIRPTSSDFERSTKPRGPRFTIDVAYRYRVGDVDYDGNRLTVAKGGDNDFSVDGMRATVAGLPVGCAQTCYVDPADPSRSVLRRDVPVSTWAAGAASLLFVGLGAACACYSLVRRQRAVA